MSGAASQRPGASAAPSGGGRASRIPPEQIVDRLGAAAPDPADAAAVARWMRLALLPHHSIAYAGADVQTRLEQFGIDVAFARYLAQRTAPLGRVPAEVVAATFYGFGPAAIAAHLPAVWDVVAPEAVLAAVLDGVDDFLARHLDDEARAAAERLSVALAPIAAAHPTAGRTLAAAWASVPATGRPLVDLWLATTLIRESRGDGHLAVLVAEGIGPIEAHLLTAGDDPERRPILVRWRALDEAEIAAAGERLRARGLLAPDGSRTDAAVALREHIEARTDATCSAPWAVAGPAVVTAVIEDALASAGPLIASDGLLGPARAALAAA